MTAYRTAQDARPEAEDPRSGAPEPTGSSHDGWFTESVVVHDAQRLATDFPGMHGEITRTGAGDGPCRVTVRQKPDVLLASINLGFPTLGWADVDRDSVVLGICTQAANGGRWDSQELSLGRVVVLPPGSFHDADEPDGLAYEMIVARARTLDKLAEELGSRLDVRRGFLDPVAATRVAHAYSKAVREGCDDHLLATLASALSEPQLVAAPRSRGLTSLEIVRRVNEHLLTTSAWMPSSTELCGAAHTSERRLEQAFHDIYDVSPSQYLRHRALSSARSRFEQHGPGELRIAHVASDLGFRSPGRFAVYYRSTFDETPSETLAASSSA